MSVVHGRFSVFEEEAAEETKVGKGTPKGRKKIRKIIDDMDLRAETQEALREEEERCKRLEDREQQMEDMRVVLSTSAFTSLLGVRGRL